MALGEQPAAPSKWKDALARLAGRPTALATVGGSAVAAEGPVWRVEWPCDRSGLESGSDKHLLELKA